LLGIGLYIGLINKGDTQMLKGFMIGLGISIGLTFGVAGVTVGGLYVTAHKVNAAMWSALDKMEGKSSKKDGKEPIQTVYCKATSLTVGEYNECIDSAFPSPFGVCLEEARETMTIASAIQKCEE
jgi:hypothetical protein